MALAVLALIAVLAVGFAFAAVALLWTGKGGGGRMKVPMPFTDKTFNVSGPAVGGALCIVAVLWLVYFAVDLVRDSGSNLPAQEVQDPAPASSGGWLSISPVMAQVTETTPPPPTVPEGWVYLGRHGDAKNWAFDLKDEESLEAGHHVYATKSMLIRADHYNDLSGTVVGKILRVAEPPVIGTIYRGTCALLADHEEVGFSALWVKIQSCEEEHSRD